MLAAVFLGSALLSQAPPPSETAFAGFPMSLQDDPAKTPEGKDGYSFYPMPAFSSDKDAGLTYGLLGALLYSDKDGVQVSLLSAAISYQHLVKWSAEVEWRATPTPLSTVDLDGYYAQHIENSLRLFYENYRAFDDFHLRVESLDFRSTTDRFFGVGDNTPRSGESVRTSNEYRAEARFGPRLSSDLDAEGTIRGRKFRASDSLITDLPQTTAAYPQQPGIEGGTVLAGGLRLVLDTRDNPTTPSCGIFTNAYFERAENWTPQKEYAYWNTGASVVALLPMDPDRQFVTVVNTATQMAVGNTIPFWELPALGGTTTLRSYNNARFLNKGMVLLNVEERIRVHEASLFGVSGEVQVAPFFDLGKVFDSMDDLVGRGGLDNFHYSVGLGFRGVVKPSFVGRLDIAVGAKEGVGVTVGLDYPF